MSSQLLIQLQICFLLILLSSLRIKFADAYIIAKPGCKDTCGDVEIPYPFGIGVGCFFDQWFEIECRGNGSKAKPFLSSFKFEVMGINRFLGHGDFLNQNVIVKIPPLKVCAAEPQARRHNSINFTGSPYQFSADDNLLVVEGCPGSAVLHGHIGGLMAGCGTVCHNNNPAIPTNSCYGVQCCQTLLHDIDFLPFYQIAVYHKASSSEGQNCLVATLIQSDSVNQYVGKLSSSDPSYAAPVPVALTWDWISQLQADTDSHASCQRSFHILYCHCIYPYEGNPYVSGGCHVPEACKDCRGYCVPRYDVEDRRSSYCKKQPPLKLATVLGISISFGVVLLVIGLYGLYRFVKRRREIKQRAKFFKRNGGLLLQQKLLCNEGLIEETKIFTVSELGKATNDFNENRILGQGGQGTVYKGMLSDGRIVAIKKAKLLDESQLEQFINEVVILSQINHRNVVKMLGCCLETEVPLLVYEFIPNGTLFQHIHHPDEDFVIGWEMLKKIVLGSASAIAYLHSSSSIPIYHRDVKSSNILLDERHRAKVSDFGSSKTIAIDQTHLTTLVQGTMGYLDPEYFQSYQFTDKSDVYSFGVVLLELLTGKKPIYMDADTMEQKNLATEFLFLMQNSRFFNILDPKIVEEAKEDELMVIVELAKCCVSWSGKLRPTMKEVEMALEMIIDSAQVSTWYQHVFHKEVAENDMAEASDPEFISNPLPASIVSPLCIDVQPLLPDTI